MTEQAEHELSPDQRAHLATCPIGESRSAAITVDAVTRTFTVDRKLTMPALSHQPTLPVVTYTTPVFITPPSPLDNPAIPFGTPMCEAAPEAAPIKPEPIITIEHFDIGQPSGFSGEFGSGAPVFESMNPETGEIRLVERGTGGFITPKPSSDPFRSKLRTFG
jgi:hypothetical protein